MSDNCPHCGTALPLVIDAFCSQCREPLGDAPETSPEKHQAHALLTTGRVLWAYVAAVSYITVLFFATGDLHAVQSVILMSILVPAIYSMFCFPLVVLYCLWRYPQGVAASLAAELLFAFTHFVVVSASIASY